MADQGKGPLTFNPRVDATLITHIKSFVVFSSLSNQRPSSSQD